MSDTASTPTPLEGQAALDALTPEARASWELTGEWPEPAKVTTTADEAPEGEPEPEPEPEPAAITTAAEPVADKSYTPPSPKSKRTAKDQEFINERIRTSVREATEALQKELADLKAKAAPAAEPKAEPKAPVTDPKDLEPKEADFEDYPSFIRATSRWAVRQDKREADAAAAEAKKLDEATASEREFTTKVSTWVERRDAFAAATPDFTKATAFLDQTKAGTPIGDVILESEVGPQLALYLATHPEEVERITRLAPISALRELGKLEAKFDTPTSASASAGPAAKTVTTAPAPPTTLSARSADPSDPVAAAVARGDYSAFEAEENRKATAAYR